MAAKLQVYKCEKCGNIVEVLHAGAGHLSCCGALMKLMVENTVDASREKHVPVVVKIDSGYKVMVGSAAHPMEEKHYIEWIELQAGEKSYREFLKPGDPPEATFEIVTDQVIARAYCNLHGLWKS